MIKLATWSHLHYYYSYYLPSPFLILIIIIILSVSLPNPSFDPQLYRYRDRIILLLFSFHLSSFLPISSLSGYNSCRATNMFPLHLCWRQRQFFQLFFIPLSLCCYKHWSLERTSSTFSLDWSAFPIVSLSKVSVRVSLEDLKCFHFTSIHIQCWEEMSMFSTGFTDQVLFLSPSLIEIVFSIHQIGPFCTRFLACFSSIHWRSWQVKRQQKSNENMETRNWITNWRFCWSLQHVSTSFFRYQRSIHFAYLNIA